MINPVRGSTIVLTSTSFLAQNRQVKLGDQELANPQSTRTLQAMLLVIVVLCVLALINAIVSTWTAVLDARHPLAVARTLGATPVQVTVGMAVAQLLPAIPGVALGVPAGIALFLVATPGDPRYAPASWMLALAITVLLTVAVLTAIPALGATRRPVADVLQSTPT